MLSVIKYSPSESARCLPYWPPRGLRQAAQGLHASRGTVYLPFLQAWAPWNFFFPPHVGGNVIATSPRPSLYFLGSLRPSFQVLGVVTGFTGSGEAPEWSWNLCFWREVGAAVEPGSVPLVDARGGPRLRERVRAFPGLLFTSTCVTCISYNIFLKLLHELNAELSWKIIQKLQNLGQFETFCQRFVSELANDRLIL